MKNAGYQMLDLIGRINAATTPAAIIEEVARSLKDCGAEYYCLHFMPRPDSTFEDAILHWTIPDDWKELYPMLWQQDTSIEYAQRTTLPFDWAEHTSPELRQIAADFRVEKAVVTPIHSALGPLGCMGATGPHFDERRQVMPLLHTIGNYAFLRARQLVGVKLEERPRLSPREGEVLSWVYKGKTAWEISKILSLSERTVEWHTQRITKKLNASNKLHAVLIAIADRLIVPMFVAASGFGLLGAYDIPEYWGIFDRWGSALLVFS